MYNIYLCIYSFERMRDNVDDLLLPTISNMTRICHKSTQSTINYSFIDYNPIHTFGAFFWTEPRLYLRNFFKINSPTWSQWRRFQKLDRWEFKFNFPRFGIRFFNMDFLKLFIRWVLWFLKHALFAMVWEIGRNVFWYALIEILPKSFILVGINCLKKWEKIWGQRTSWSRCTLMGILIWGMPCCAYSFLWQRMHLLDTPTVVCKSFQACTTQLFIVNTDKKRLALFNGSSRDSGRGKGWNDARAGNGKSERP